jgi:hypothetical protein
LEMQESGVAAEVAVAGVAVEAVRGKEEVRPWRPARGVRAESSFKGGK